MPQDPRDLQASIDTLDLDPEVTGQLKAIGATTIGVLYLMSLGDFIERLDSSCEEVVNELRKLKMKPKGETTPLLTKAKPFGGIVNLPIGYLVVTRVISDLQCQALENQDVSTWGELADFSERGLTQLTVNDQSVFTTDDIKRIESILKRQGIVLKW